MAWGAFRFLVGLAWLGAILRLTLVPGTVSDPAGGPDAISNWCVLCGAHGTADFLRNVLFFVPLGWAVAPWFGRFGGGLAVAFLSLGIEVTQLGLPGRYSTLGDLIANGGGGFLGAWLSAEWRRGFSVLISGRRSIWLGSLATSVLLLLSPIITYQSSHPDRVYYFQWTADLGGSLGQYRGELRQAFVDGRRAPQGRVGDTAEWLRPALQRDRTIDLRFTVGPPPRRLSPVFSIYDDRQREVLLIGVDHRDLVVRRRQVAENLRLDQPVIRWRNAFADVPPGSPAEIRFGRGGSRETKLCLLLNERENCSATVGLDGGWSMLYAAGRFGPNAHRVFALLWVTGIAFMAAVSAGSVYRVAAGVSALAAVGVVGTLVAPHLSFHTALPAGLLVGSLLGAWLGSIGRARTS